jgi:transketolase
MRNQFAKSLVKLSALNNDIFLVYGDIGNKLFDDFKANFDSRFINAGVAESSMVTMASGLAKNGFKPIVYTINSFLYLKALEQIKIDICYPNLPVILVGTGGGLGYSELGTTHHSLEDIGILTTLPNLQVLVPSDIFEVDYALKWAFQSKKPTYIRIGKKDEQTVHSNFLENQAIEFGPYKINEVSNCKSAIISYGSISIEIAKIIADHSNNFKIEHWTFPCIKPISKSQIQNFLKYDTLIIIEEHTPFGSLASILLSMFNILSLEIPRILSINTGDSFHTGLGKIENARDQLGMSNSKIIKFIRDNIA